MVFNPQRNLYSERDQDSGESVLFFTEEPQELNPSIYYRTSSSLGPQPFIQTVMISSGKSQWRHGGTIGPEFLVFSCIESEKKANMVSLRSSDQRIAPVLCAIDPEGMTLGTPILSAPVEGPVDMTLSYDSDTHTYHMYYYVNAWTSSTSSNSNFLASKLYDGDDAGTFNLNNWWVNPDTDFTFFAMSSGGARILMHTVLTRHNVEDSNGREQDIFLGTYPELVAYWKMDTAVVSTSGITVENSFGVGHVEQVDLWTELHGDNVPYLYKGLAGDEIRIAGHGVTGCDHLTGEIDFVCELEEGVDCCISKVSQGTIVVVDGCICDFYCGN